MLTNFTKSFISILIVCILLLVSGPLVIFEIDSVKALPLDGTTEVFVSPGSNAVGFSETFYLWVNCTPGQPVNSFEFEMDYNPAVLQAVAVTEGNIFNGFSTMFNSGTINNNAGTIVDIYNLILGVGNVTGDGSLVCIEFESSDGYGISSIGLNSVGVTNESDYVNISTSNGLVIVTGDPIIHEQSYNYTLWDNQDGTFTMKLGPSGIPFSFYNDTGWHPVNTTIKELPEDHVGYNYNYRYYNPDGVFEAYFKNSSDKSFPVGFLYDKDENDNTSYYLRSKLVQAGYMEPNNYSWDALFDVNDRDIIVDNDTARYENVFPTGVDVNYSYENHRLKEEIICPPATLTGLLNNPPSDFGYDNDTAFFVFVTQLDMGAVTAYNNGTIEIDGNYTMDDGRIVFKNISGDIKYAMPLDYVYEQNNIYNRTKLRFQLVRNDSKDYLVVGIRYRHLINMTFPVVFDPTTQFMEYNGQNGVLSYESGVPHIWDDVRFGVGGTGPTEVNDKVAGGGHDGAPTPLTCYRGYTFWDTDSIEGWATVSKVNISFTTGTCFDNDDLSFHVLRDSDWVFPGSELTTADYSLVEYDDDLGETSIIGSMTEYNFSLTPAVDAVNLDGVTSYCLREDHNDYDGNLPNGIGYDNYFVIDLEADIHLWVTYSVAWAPVITNEDPADGSTDVALNTDVNVTITDANSDTMNLSFYTNATGPWTWIGSHNNTNDGFKVNSTSLFSSIETKYWWCANVSDGMGNWTNATYSFTTLAPVVGVEVTMDNFSYYKVITIESDLVVGDHTDFPILVHNTSSDFSSHAQADGDDFVFMNDDNTTQYNHEIDYYDDGTGELIAWVNITLLDGDADQTIILWYGNATTGSQENITGTWDDNFSAVYHMNGANVNEILDSTRHSHDGTADSGSPTYEQSGRIGYAVDFQPGTPDCEIETDQILSEANTTLDSHTWEVWINPDSSNTRYFISQWGNSDGIMAQYYSNLLQVYYDGSKKYEQAYTVTNEWFYVAWRQMHNDVGGDGSLFVNSTEVEDDVSGTGITWDACPFSIANDDNGASEFDGTVDEIRIHNIGRSNNWLITSFNTMNGSSNGFVTVGAETEKPANFAPTQSNQGTWHEHTLEEKTMNSVAVDMNFTQFNITIADVDVADTMNLTMYRNNEDAWGEVNSSTGLSDGTVIYTNVSWVKHWDTLYTVSFNLSDGTSWSNVTKTFRMGNFTGEAISVNASQSGCARYGYIAVDNVTGQFIQQTQGGVQGETSEYPDVPYYALYNAYEGLIVNHTNVFSGDGTNSSEIIHPSWGWVNQEYWVVGKNESDSDIGGCNDTTWNGFASQNSSLASHLLETPQNVNLIVELYALNRTNGKLIYMETNSGNYYVGLKNYTNGAFDIEWIIPETESSDIITATDYFRYNATIHYIFFINRTTSSLIYIKSIDGGDTWGTPQNTSIPNVGNTLDERVSIARYGNDRFYVIFSGGSGGDYHDIKIYTTDDLDGSWTDTSLGWGASDNVCHGTLLNPGCLIVTYNTGGSDPPLQYNFIRFVNVTRMNSYAEKADTPSPADTATVFGDNTTLNVAVNGNQTYDVSFYWANGTLLGTDRLLDGDATATITVTGLNDVTTYNWYTITRGTQHDDYRDSEPMNTWDENQSVTWDFTTDFNTLPTQSGESPADGLINVALNTDVSVTVTDADGDTMNLSFYTNATGPWTWIGSHNNTGDGNKVNSSSVFSSYITKYWWSANVSDGYEWTNATYSFTTTVDPIPFGQDDITDSHASTDNIWGSDGSPNADGYAYNISIYIDGWGSGEKIKCALYTNNATQDEDFIAETEERDDGSGGVGWETFNFTSNVRIYDAWNYWVVGWTDDTITIYWGGPAPGPGATYTPQAYNGWPNNLTEEAAWREYDILCNWETTAQYANAAPVQSDEAPTSGKTGVSLEPDLYVICTDGEGDTMNATWMSNSSGSWIQFAVANTSITSGTNITQNNSNFSTSSTKYWWSVNLSDGEGNWDNDTYSLTTEGDLTAPTVVINFAGNLGDTGGPYWRPDGETTALSGDFSDGYSTNDSRQDEDWRYINCTITDGESAVTDVWLQWYNKSSDIWTNWTYSLSNPGGDSWEINTSGIIQTEAGNLYSFNIVANSSGGTDTETWTKIGPHLYTPLRRYVGLNYSTVNISYVPYYMIKANETFSDPEDDFTADRFHHDSGVDGTATDGGYLRTYTPGDTVEWVRCEAFVAYWFDESQCVEDFDLINIYYRIWYGSDTDLTGADDGIGWDYRRDELWIAPDWSSDINDDYKTTHADNRSEIYYDNGDPTWSNNYSLDTHLLDITDQEFDDNNIYELVIGLSDFDENPSVISNRSFSSFIILNVPSNATLNASHSDTDSDGLSDWYELYKIYTNPFLADTDNDGVSDYDENITGSDPNNWTDTIPLSNNAPTQSGETPVNSSIGMAITPDLYVIGSDADGADTLNATWWSNSTHPDSFGETSTIRDTAESVANHIRWSCFYSTYDGIANNITVYARSDAGSKWKCALYNNATDELIAQTEEITLPALVAQYHWRVFNFTSTVYIDPTIEYRLCAWANASGTNIVGSIWDGWHGDKYRNYDVLTGEYLATETESITENTTIMIYLNYTVNESEEWYQFGGNETGFSSDTNITQNNANFSDYSTTYYWSVNLTDGEGGWNNETYHFTTESAPNNPPTQSGESPVNTSTEISITPDLYIICNDTDGDALNATWWSNSTHTDQFGLADSAEGDNDRGVEDYVRATGYTCVFNGTANNITIHMRTSTAAKNIKVGIWDNSSSPKPLLATSEERLIQPSGTYRWEVFNITYNNLTAGVEYLIGLFSASGDGVAYVNTDTSTAQSMYGDSEAYNGLPDPIYESAITTGERLLIYMNYTVNESEEWYQFGGNETGFSSDTNITQNNANFSDSLTTYYWSVNLTDGEGGWNNETYHFTTLANNNDPVQSGEAPTNASIDVSLTPDLYVICTDTDGDTLNATWWSNSTHPKTFGNSGAKGTSQNIEDTLRGTPFLCQYNGIADNITVYLKIDVAAKKVKLAIYDNTTDDLIGYTEERTILGETWYTFNITSGGEFTANTLYGLYAWCESGTGVGEVGYTSDSNFDVYFDSETYNGFPDPINKAVINSDWKVMMYCSYTVNASEEWYQFGANETGFSSGTNITQNNANFSDYSTKYWWSVNLTDGEEGWNNETYHFTTGVNYRPTVGTPSPVNNSISNLKTPTCSVVVNDVNADSNPLTVEWYENTTGSWVLQQTNSSLSDGNTVIWQFTNANSFDTKYYFKCVVNDTLLENSSVFNFKTMNFNASFSFNISDVVAGNHFTMIDESGGNATHIEWRVAGVNLSHIEQAQGGGHAQFNYSCLLNLSNNYTIGMYIYNSEGGYHEWYNTTYNVDRNISYSKTNSSVGYNYVGYHLDASINATDFATSFSIPNQQWIHKYNTTTNSWNSQWVGMAGDDFDIDTWDVVIVSSMLNTTVQVNITDSVNFTQNTSSSSGYNYYCWSNGTSCNLSTAATSMGLQTGDWVFKYNSNNGTWDSYWVGFTGDDVTINPYDILVCNVAASRDIFITDEELGDGI